MTELLKILNTAGGDSAAAVLNALPVAMLAVLLTWAICRFTPRINAAWRHRLWWATLCMVLLIPFAPPATNQTAEAPVAPVPVASPALPVLTEAAPVLPPDPSPEALLPFRIAGAWPLVLLALAITALAVQTVRVSSSYRYLSTLRRRCRQAPPEVRLSFDEWAIGCGLRRPVRLLISDEIPTAIAIGFRDPAVILPASFLTELGEQDIDHIVLHELAHLARRDDWSNLLAQLAYGAIWMHPLALWILCRIEQEREMACDDWVVSATGDARPYAVSLARILEMRLGQPGALLATGIGERRSDIADRIERLLKAGRNLTARPSRVRVAISCGAAVAVLLLVASTRPDWIVFAQEADRPPVPPVPVAVPAPPAPAARPSRPVRKVPPPPAPTVAAIAGSGTSLLAALSAAGYQDLPVDDIINLKNHGVTGQFLLAMRDSGWGRLNAAQLIELRTHNVSPEYAHAMRLAGIRDLTLREVVELRSHGVPQDYPQSIHDLGMGPYGARQFIEIRNHGLRTEYLRGFVENGYGSADIRELIEAYSHGVRPGDLREAKRYGPALSLKQVIRLKQAGVI